jgi:hypothetical protein
VYIKVLIENTAKLCHGNIMVDLNHGIKFVQIKSLNLIGHLFLFQSVMEFMYSLFEKLSFMNGKVKIADSDQSHSSP